MKTKDICFKTLKNKTICGNFNGKAIGLSFL